ncbi:MAG: Rieske (2Fe-2S) protein [Anaerolineae bacterium]|jgi:cytochrome b6-f complex iron-sulfur subunit
MNETVNMTEDAPSQDPVSRRGFIKYALLGFSGLATAVGVLTPIVAYLWPPKQGSGGGGERVNVASTADLPTGTGEIYSVANKPVIVIHTPDGDFVALSATCTHLGCILFWDTERQVIACPCHEAYFNTIGDVISGPPPSPLVEYRVQVDGDQIYVEGEQG